MQWKFTSGLTILVGTARKLTSQQKRPGAYKHVALYYFLADGSSHSFININASGSFHGIFRSCIFISSPRKDQGQIKVHACRMLGADTVVCEWISYGLKVSWDGTSGVAGRVADVWHLECGLDVAILAIVCRLQGTGIFCGPGIRVPLSSKNSAVVKWHMEWSTLVLLLFEKIMHKNLKCGKKFMIYRICDN